MKCEGMGIGAERLEMVDRHFVPVDRADALEMVDRLRLLDHCVVRPHLGADRY